VILLDTVRYFANPSTEQVRDAMTAGQLGTIITPKQRQGVPLGATWCADNGCFGKGYPGDDAWIAWLIGLQHDLTKCEFAVAPDVVGDAVATMARSAPWLKCRDLGYPAAFAAQDGLEKCVIPWSTFDVLFIGGSTEWKEGPHAQDIAGEARARGLRVHMGRVNSKRRLLIAKEFGCTSADGTFISFGPDKNLPLMLRWLKEVEETTVAALLERPYSVEVLTPAGAWETWSTFINQSNAQARASELALLHEVRVTCSHGCPPNACLL